MPRRPTIPIIPAGHAPHSAVREADADHHDAVALGIDRRAFLKLMAASAALASAGCSGPPLEQIVPYAHMPELAVPGQPVYYASAFVRRGYAQGVLVESNMGRPTKIEGNPRHPASSGATDIFAQASILQFWDPDRSQAVYQRAALSTWEAFETALQSQRGMWDANAGAGLRLLTGSVSSPTLHDQLVGLLRRYPKARWHHHEPLHDDLAFDAAKLAFGKPVDTMFRIDRTAMVLSADADIFGDWPGGIRYARDFVADRRSHVATFANRLYALQTSPNLTGAMADSAMTMHPHEIEWMLWRLAVRLGITGISSSIPSAVGNETAKWETALANTLLANKGRSLIVAGGSISARTRALVHLMNAHLGNIGTTVDHIDAVEAMPENHADSMAALVADMRAGQVTSLVMLDTNPVYSAPADLDFPGALERVPFSAHLGLYRDETARRASWHIPKSHGYEHWSDARAHDGTASIVQPVIAPLYGGLSAHQLIALLSRDTERGGHALVRRYWQRHAGGADFEGFWETALRTGIVEHSASIPLRRKPGMPPPPAFVSAPLMAVFAPDASIGAGEFANNAWLQELPKPFTKLTWDNAALISAATAQSIGVVTGDMVRLSLRDAPAVVLDAPVWVLPGQADGVVTLPLGYGRGAAGRVGDRVGFDAYRLRTMAAVRGSAALQVQKTGKRHVFATTQNHATMEGRDIVRVAVLAEYRRNPHFATDEPRKRSPRMSLYPGWEYTGYKWGMAIDLNACIGCNACTIACQAENNIPVVGKEEVIRGREMHWIRVDRYFMHGDKNTAGQARIVFQPVPCMHCEKAPCEEVCPVEAAIHDSEGLNMQVYNRCIGTRFCSNNCPYKVRRFNFLQYANTDIESLKAAQNPEVTVRRRGVMEKCTYCVQRITRARIGAEELGRRLHDGEVITACQAVCPTEAIVFGDLNDPNSKVNRAKASPLDYALLAELSTQPRTTYAARVINPDPELE